MWQEILVISLVILIIGRWLYRWLSSNKSTQSKSGCGCDKCG